MLTIPRVLDRTFPDIASNLALDEALLAEVEEAGVPPVLRLWEAPGPAVVLGASCRWRQSVLVDRCRADGVPITRRSSGGGTVVVGPGALNATVVLPIAAAPELAAVDVAQCFVLEQFAKALRAEGVPAAVQGSGDLTIGPRKFSGSAQRRLRWHVMIHATILYAFPLDQIWTYTPPPVRQPAYRAGRSHEDFVVNIGLPRERLVSAIRRAWLGPLAEPAAVPEERVRALLAEKFGDPAWVERF